MKPRPISLVNAPNLGAIFWPKPAMRGLLMHHCSSCMGLPAASKPHYLVAIVSSLPLQALWLREDLFQRAKRPFWDDTGGVPNLTSSSSHPLQSWRSEVRKPAQASWSRRNCVLNMKHLLRLHSQGDRSPAFRCDRRRKQTLSRVFRDHGLKGKPARAVWNVLGTLRQILTRSGAGDSEMLPSET